MPFDFIDQDPAPGEPMKGCRYAWQVYRLGAAPEAVSTHGSVAGAAGELLELLAKTEIGRPVCIRRVIDGADS